MRVLHIITGLGMGGAERVLFNVLEGGLSSRFENAVVSLKDEGVYGGRVRELDVAVHALGLRGSLTAPSAISELRRIVKAHRPDLVQGWMYHGNVAASLAAWLSPGHPAVAWNIRHSLYSQGVEKRLTSHVIRANRCLSKYVGGIVYNSSLARQQHEAFGFAATKARVIPNGFDVKTLRPSGSERKAARQELAIPDGDLVVGHVARFHPMKDHGSFLEAAVQVARKLPQVRFLIAGREVNLENSRLAGFVPPSLQDRFHFVGEREDVPKLMQAMDVLCTSSAWGEAFPNVLGEAMATGVPCVATDVGDSSDIVGATGIILPPSDSAALARGLMSMLDKSSDERRALGLAARARVEAHYALPRIVDAYNALYESFVPTSAAGTMQRK